MSKLSLTQKTTRVLRFLLGLRQPQIAGLLVAHGFGDNDLEEGWRMLREAVGARLDRATPPAPPPVKTKQLDQFENKWFPIAAATLQRAYPQVNEKLFLNLSQTEGAEVVVSVGTFIERIEALGTDDDGRADREDAEARALLERRGLTTAVITQAKQLIEGLERKASAEEMPIDPEPEFTERQLAAERAMWAWYREWSSISRAIIKNRNYLRQLGFLQRSVSHDQGEPPLEPEVVTTSGSTTSPEEPAEPTVPVPPETGDSTPVVNA